MLETFERTNIHTHTRARARESIGSANDGESTHWDHRIKCRDSFYRVKRSNVRNKVDKLWHPVRLLVPTRFAQSCMNVEERISRYEDAGWRDREWRFGLTGNSTVWLLIRVGRNVRGESREIERGTRNTRDGAAVVNVTNMECPRVA